jgi:hypothetical protein
MTNLQTNSNISTAQVSPSAKEKKTFNCPVPKALLPFLDKMGVQYKKAGIPCALSNMENVEIEMKSDFDLTGIIYAAWQHGLTITTRQ